MKYETVEEQLENYRARKRAEENAELMRRILVPRTTEEMIRLFRSSPEFWVRTDEYSAS